MSGTFLGWCAALSAVAVPAGAGAQTFGDEVLAPPRVYIGANLAAAVSVGEFRKYVEAGAGLGGYVLFRPIPTGIFGVRLGATFLIYGSETRRRPLSETVPFVTVDVTTSNNIFALDAGPQLTFGRGAIRGYLHGAAGFSYFATVSSVRGAENVEAFARSTNFDEVTFAAQGGGGLWIALSRRRTPVFLELSARFVNNGSVRYLREGSIREGPGGTLLFTPIESETNLMVYQIGVAVGARAARKELPPE